MSNYSDELVVKLKKAKSLEEVTELLKADGQDIAEAEKIWGEIKVSIEQEGKELSLDELDAVAGGRALAVRDHPTDYLSKDLYTCAYFKGGWREKKAAVLRTLGPINDLH